jgi:ubiquinone/menaquinone biosynthesis C-methylase UbiE
LLRTDRRVTAVDSSAYMLSKLRAKRSWVGQAWNRLTIIQDNAESLTELLDSTFAAVSLQLVLFDMAQPLRGLDVASRILRPGGTIVITDLKRCFDVSPLLAECERQLRLLDLYEERAEDLLRVVNSNRALAPGTRSDVRIEDVYSVLASNGFGELTFQDSHLGQCATVVGRKSSQAFNGQSGLQ